MSYDHTADGSGGYIGTYPLPVNGADARTAASVTEPLKLLANDLAAVQIENQGGASVTRRRRLKPIVPFDGSTVEWLFPNGGGEAVTSLAPDIENTRHQIIAPLELPHGATATYFTFWCVPNTGHSALPLLMPRVLLKRRDLSTGTTTTLATLNDSTATVGAYTGARHRIQGVVSFTLDRSAYSYFLILESEGDTDARDTFTWELDYEVTFTSPTQRDQGAA
ncbi:MAG: hypothetical protein U0271_34200 [Polyangiaceae bacterium]